MSTNIYVMKKNISNLTLMGTLENEQIITIYKEANKKNLTCFSGLDYIGYTIYNHKQISEIKSENAKLKKINEISTSIGIIETVLTKIPDNNEYYLVFEGE